MKDTMESLHQVNRVEVISSKGREYVNLNCENVHLAFQDEGRTLKVFLNLDAERLTD
ncbi:MAG: hypothetical protein AAGA53_05760 [Pseudomonadota bacterium]